MKISGALVINAQQNGLGVVRSLAALDPTWPIYSADPQAPNATAYSRYVKKSFVTPLVTDEAFVGELRKLGRDLSNEEGKILLIGTNDEYVTAFADHWNELEEFFYPMFLTDSEALLDCLHKGRAYALADRVQVPMPAMRKSAKQYLDEGLPLPAVIKPDLRRTKDGIKKGVYRIAWCQSPDELIQNAKILEDLDASYVIQEYIEGGDDQLYTAGVACREGETLAVYTGRKLRQFPPRTGIAALAESIRVQKIADYAERLMSESAFEGVAQVEFKRRDDEYYLMEINPRPWAWNSLSTDSGVNLIAAWLKGHGVEGVHYPDSFKQISQQRTWMHVYPDFQHNVVSSKGITMREFLASIWKSDSKAFWVISDPLPGIVESCRSVKLAAKIVFKKLGAKLFSSKK